MCLNLFTLEIDNTTISCHILVIERKNTWLAHSRSTEISYYSVMIINFELYKFFTLSLYIPIQHSYIAIPALEQVHLL